MRAFLLLLFAAAVVGCAGDAPAKEEAPATPVAKSAPPAQTPAGHPPVGPGKADKLDRKQIQVFITELGKIAGHGNASAKDIAEMNKQVLAIQVGKTQGGAIHIDHAGSHSDILMTIKRAGPDVWEVSVNGKDPGAMEEVKKMMEKAKN